MPFAEYSSFEACVRANSDKDNPEAYCATIMRKTEGKTGKSIYGEIMKFCPTCNIEHLEGKHVKTASINDIKFDILKLQVANIRTAQHDHNAQVPPPTQYMSSEWWDELPVTKRQHAVDPNRLEDAKSLEFSQKNHSQIEQEGQCPVIYLAYAFRHQDADTTELLGENIHVNPPIWWNAWSVSQRHHMVDPHQLDMPESLEFCKLSYEDMSSEQQEKVDKMFQDKHTEEGTQSKSASIKDSLTKIKDKQHTCSICGDDEEHQKTGKMVTGSLTEDYTNSSGRFVAYFLLRGDHINLKEWGVTSESIPQRIASFKGMPFVITSNKFFPTSPYREIYDHPSTEHFPKLGISKTGNYNPNDMMLQAEFQEHFRVGSIVDVAKKGQDWVALIKVLPKFANYQMPPLVSPAIFKLNPRESDGRISTWTGMHLAGLDEKPAYGNIAVYYGSCDGTQGECLKQLTAKMTGNKMVIPVCEKMEMVQRMEAKILVWNMESKLASMQSSDHDNIKRLNVKKKNMNFSEMQSLQTS